ncbi:hypothetical protein ES703_69885 [subsurface metagenome]
MCAGSLPSAWRTESFSLVKSAPCWWKAEKILAVRAGSDSVISAKAEDWGCKRLGKKRAATQGRVESESSRRIASSTWWATIVVLDGLSGI